MLRASSRQIIAWVALITAVVSAAWTILLVLYGGVDVNLLGLRISSHDLVRPLALAVVSAAVYVWTTGLRRTVAQIAWVFGAIADGIDRVDSRIVVGTLVIALTAAGVVYGSKAAGGSDSYGYISQADLWLSGHLTIAQPWIREVPWPAADRTFAPLGYRPGPDRATIVPVYSPGLPILMALAKALAGSCAVFWVVPLSGGVLALATYGIGRRLGMAREGAIGSWLVVTSPAVLFMLMAPMTDVPIAAAWAVVFWSLLGGTVRSAAIAGLSTGLAVLIRPNLAPMVAFPTLWFALKAWRSPGEERSRRVLNLVVFLTALTPAVIGVAALNQFWYGSPVHSGYGPLQMIFAWANVLTNLKHYSAWLVQTQTPAVLLGAAALLMPVPWLWPRATDRSFIGLSAGFVLAMWAEFCLYEVFDAWWYLRFLLPCWPFIMLGLAAVLQLPSRSRTVIGRLVTATLVLLLGANGLRLAAQENVFGTQRGENKYPSVARIVRQRTDRNAVIFSGQHSGSLRYYAGRTTMRYFDLDRSSLDLAVGWLSDHGSHPYALLEDWEMKEFRERFSTLSAIGRLEMPPLFLYQDGSKIYFFDLLRSAGSALPDEVIAETGAVACQPPAPPPKLVFTH